MPRLKLEFANRRGQSGVDILVIVVMVLLVIIFLTSGGNLHSLDASSMRYKSVAVMQDKGALLNNRDSSIFKNATVSEIISMHYCGFNNRQQLETLLSNYFDVIGNASYNYIAMVCPEGNCSNYKTLVFCSPGVESQFGRCCVRLESVTVAKSSLRLDVQNGCLFDEIQFVLGRWPIDEAAEACS